MHDKVLLEGPLKNHMRVFVYVSARRSLDHASLVHRVHRPTLIRQDRATCRFFYLWPHQPYQCYCMNTERIALQRRLVEDDQWVVPHNLYIAMYSPSSVNVLPFDPHRGCLTLVP